MEMIGRYKVGNKIGAGGMAEVFLAHSRGAQDTEKQLVIKKIHPALAKNDKFIAMFVDEAHVAIRLNHTNIVQVYAFEHIDDAYILAMEYVDGTDLLRLETSVADGGRRFPFGLAAYITAEVAKGLDYAHSRRDDYGEPLEIVHRDVSPQNILISREGAAKIADFGIARARWLHEDAPGAIKGKFGYMSPEQAQGLPVDRRTDIYALGVVLYELIIGRPLFQFPQGVDPRQVICDTRHPGPKSHDPEVPEALNAIVLKAIAHDARNRFETARDMARTLTEYLHSEEEIYDAQALETFISEYHTQPQWDSSDTDSFSENPTRVVTAKRQVSSVSDALGAVEQRSSIAVTGRLEIEPHPSRNDVHFQLMRLIGEMAFKSDAVLRKDASHFFLYLGLVRTAMEDAISAVRLAYDVQDATHALSRDNRLKIKLKLAVCKGVVHDMSGIGNPPVNFEPDPDFLRKCEFLTERAGDAGIFADDQVFKLARRDYHFELASKNGYLDTPAQAGVAVESQVYRIAGMRSREDRSRKAEDLGIFLGREPELETLFEAFSQAENGHPQIYKLAGEMGIGKTRFIEEFLQKSMSGTTEVLTAECLFVERDRPMAAAAAAYRTILSLGEGQIEKTLEERLGEIFNKVPSYRKRQFGFLKEFLVSPDTMWVKNPSKRRALVQRAAFGMGVLLSMRARSRTVVLVVENAHWLDGPSIDVLSELAHERPQVRIFVLLVGHPITLVGRKIANLQEIELTEMQDSAIRALVLERLGTSDSMKAIAEQIIRRAHGNPFFANEIIDSLIEQKIVVQMKGNGNGSAKYRQERPGTIRLPATMEGIAASRIAALPPSQRTVLRAAAAIGASFDAETVSVLVGRDAAEEIIALTTEGVLVESPREAESTPMYRFRQPMMREVAYDGLEAKDRKRIHRIIAKRLQAAAKEGVAVPNARIAWHLEGAGESEQAGSLYVTAGNAAAAIYSDREALKLLDRAIPLIRANSREKFHALALRETLLRYVGRFAERERETGELKRIAVLLDDPVLIAKSLTRRAQLEHDLGDLGSAARLLTEALEIARQSNDTERQVEALRLLAFVAIQGGHLFRAIDCANRAVSAIRANDESEFFLLALALDVRGFALFQMGHLDDAARPMAEALVLFRRLGKQRHESQVLDHLALLARNRGEMIEAIEFLERALRIDIRVRAARPRGLKLATMGSIGIDIGNFDGAYADLAEAERICKDNKERMGQAEVQLDLARLKIIEERYVKAAKILERMEQEKTVSQSRILLVKHHQLLAMAYLGDERLHEARMRADEAARIALEAGMNGEAIHGIALQGLVMAIMGETDEAVNATRRATDMLVMLRRVRDAEQVWWYQSLTFKKTGDGYLAKRALEEARVEASKKRRRMKDERRQSYFDAHPWIKRIIQGF